ncbi:hypothetical protein Aca07nite_82700 [Actinoplanes capillaceus]|uniref:TadE-like protein n=1 Tax=Actinoplanes campanulatus TaxID=113559 RepID=A0ABQ3WXI9_9ACTN|nr:hypothetical protein Aca07nite_82700 [Actinoplanes capillaceus]
MWASTCSATVAEVTGALVLFAVVAVASVFLLLVFLTVTLGLAFREAEADGAAGVPGTALAEGAVEGSGDSAAASGVFNDRGSGAGPVPPCASPATRKPAPITTAVDPAARVYRNRAAAERGTVNSPR